MLVKVEYLVEVDDKDGKKVIWDVFNNHVVEKGFEHEELGLQGFDFNLFDGEREGGVGDGLKDLPYLLMLMKLWPDDWEEQFDRTNKKLDDENGRWGTQENGRFWKLQRFSRNELWKNIGCLLLAPNYRLGVSRLWEKDPKISGKNRKMSLI